MRSRESRRRERRIARRMSTPILLLAGDEGPVLDSLRDDAQKYGIPVVPEAGSPDVADSPPPTVAIVVARVIDDRSALRRGLATLDAQEHRLTPTTVRIVVILSGASKIVPSKLRGALTREILYQVESGLFPDEHSRPWRSLRLRSGSTLLRALGIKVFRVPSAT